MRRLAILSTHPIQYNAPFFRMLDDDSTLKVLVFFSKTSDQVKFDPDFRREIVWDIPVTEGYDHVSHDASTVSGRNALIGSIRAFAPDALLVYGWNFPGHLKALRHFHGRIPVWFRGDSHLLDPAPPLKKLARRAFLSWVYRHVDVAFSVGAANEAYFTWCGLRPHQLIRAPHSVEQHHFQNEDELQKKAAMQWRIELGIPTHADVILFAGKLEEKTGKDIQATGKAGNPMSTGLAGTPPAIKDCPAQERRGAQEKLGELRRGLGELRRSWG